MCGLVVVVARARQRHRRQQVEREHVVRLVVLDDATVGRRLQFRVVGACHGQVTVGG